LASIFFLKKIVVCVVAAESRMRRQIRSRDLGADLLAEPEERALGEIKLAVFKVGDNPVAADFSFRQRGSHQLPARKFVPGNPGAGDAHAKAQPDRFFDRLGAAEFDDRAEAGAELGSRG
jgi:hypothetical protein